MLNRQNLADETASFKADSKKHFDDALVKLLALVWPYGKDSFTFEENPAVYDDAMAICVELSDKCAESARKRLKRAVAGLEDADIDELWEQIYENEDEARFDRAGSHLLDLLEVWISIAFINKWEQGYTRIMISRYLSNPFLCPEWRHVPLSALAWGSGYARNIAEQLAVIGQGIILNGARFAEWLEETEKGATYYIMHRGSNYDCPTCDEMCEKPIPITTPVPWPHARCMCWPEYFYNSL